jgi:hypothetical protein
MLLSLNEAQKNLLVIYGPIAVKLLTPFTSYSNNHETNISQLTR